jgi:hypothetical protein
MSVDVTVEQPIARDRETVASFAMDPANDLRWIGALSSARVLSPGPVGAGTRVERVARFLGRRIEYVNEITAYEPGRGLKMRSVRAPFPMTVEYDFEDAGDGATLARIRAGGETGRYYALAGPLLSFMVRRGIARDLRALKRAVDG